MPVANPVDLWPALESHIGADVDEQRGRVVVFSALDNLGKGAAGSAIQNMNCMLGLAEETGLTGVGLHP